MSQCSEDEELLLAFVKAYRSDILTTSLHCKVHFVFKQKKDSISTWFAVT